MSAVLERKDLHCRITKARRNGQFEAVIATLGVVDSDGDIIVPGAFGDATTSIMPAHDHGSMPLGKAKLQDRGDEAIAVGQFNLDIRPGRDWHSAIRFDLENGDSIQEWSFAFLVLDSETETRDGEEVRILKKLDVMEVSPVLRGAGIDTRTLTVKQRRDRLGPVLGDLDDRTQDLQQLLATATPAQRRNARPAVQSMIDRVSRFARDLVGGKHSSDIEKLAYAEWTTIEAKIIFENLDRERFKYKFCKTNELTRKGAQEIAAIVSGQLGVDTPEIRFFRPVEYESEADFGYKDAINGLAVGGETINGRPTIYVRDRALGKSIETIAHECRHVWQRKAGWNMADKDRIEDDAYAFGDWFALKCDLPMYADLVVTEDYPPTKFGTAGSLFGLFHFNGKSGQIHRAYGDAPWPRWVHHRTVDIESLR